MILSLENHCPKQFVYSTVGGSSNQDHDYFKYLYIYDFFNMKIADVQAHVLCCELVDWLFSFFITKYFKGGYSIRLINLIATLIYFISAKLHVLSVNKSVLIC